MTSPYRILGWGFEIFMDLFSAIVIATFWGFINTSCTPDFANKGYGFIAAVGKVGGILSPLLGLYIANWTSLETSTSLPLLIFISGLLLFATLGIIKIITIWIPKEYLMGYQAIHQAELAPKKKKAKPGVFEGLKLMLTKPYVMGIFVLLFSIEVISIIFDYQMQVIMSVESNNHIGTMTNSMFLFTACFQALGFIFAIAGTAPLLRIIGIRACLLLVPMILIGLTTTLLVIPTFSTIFVIMVIIKALNYGFNFPIREMLYIPTTKNIQFKSKAWIESFGKTFSKTTASGINILTISDNLYKLLSLNAMWSFAICFFYLIASFFVGRKYVQTIEKDELIG
jgi:AAA family ATP:ADP antiporter